MEGLGHFLGTIWIQVITAWAFHPIIYALVTLGIAWKLMGKFNFKMWLLVYIAIPMLFLVACIPLMIIFGGNFS